MNPLFLIFLTAVIRNVSSSSQSKESFVIPKVDFQGLQSSDVETVKYLSAMFQKYGSVQIVGQSINYY